MIFRILITLALITAGSIAVAAQTPPPQTVIPNSRPDRSRLNQPSDDDDAIGSPADEMRARNEIKLAEKERAENLDRARETAQLGEEIRQAFSKNKSLNAAEIKKLERMEKLARRVRERAGGSDDDEPLEKVPNALEQAIDRLAETSDALSKGVEKTPRQVISTHVIKCANELIEIIHFVRSSLR